MAHIQEKRCGEVFHYLDTAVYYFSEYVSGNAQCRHATADGAGCR